MIDTSKELETRERLNLLHRYVIVDQPYKEMDSGMYEELWKIPELSIPSRKGLPKLLLHVRDSRYISTYEGYETASGIVSCACVRDIICFASAICVSGSATFFRVDTSLIKEDNYVHVPTSVDALMSAGHDIFSSDVRRIDNEQEFIVPFTKGLLEPIAECKGYSIVDLRNVVEELCHEYGETLCETD